MAVSGDALEREKEAVRVELRKKIEETEVYWRRLEDLGDPVAKQYFHDKWNPKGPPAWALPAGLLAFVLFYYLSALALDGSYYREVSHQAYYILDPLSEEVRNLEFHVGRFDDEDWKDVVPDVAETTKAIDEQLGKLDIDKLAPSSYIPGD